MKFVCTFLMHWKYSCNPVKSLREISLVVIIKSWYSVACGVNRFEHRKTGQTNVETGHHLPHGQLMTRSRHWYTATYRYDITYDTWLLICDMSHVFLSISSTVSTFRSIQVSRWLCYLQRIWFVISDFNLLLSTASLPRELPASWMNFLKFLSYLKEGEDAFIHRWLLVDLMVQTQNNLAALEKKSVAGLAVSDRYYINIINMIGGIPVRAHSFAMVWFAYWAAVQRSLQKQTPLFTLRSCRVKCRNCARRLFGMGPFDLPMTGLMAEAIDICPEAVEANLRDDK